MKTPEYKSALIDGVIQYLSVSQFTTFDESQHGGCERKWFFDKKLKLPRRVTKAQATGTELHLQNEHFLKTGEDIRAAVAYAGKRFVPERGPDLLIEHPLAGLTAGGFPMVGFIDLVHKRGEYIDEDGALVREAQLTAEVIDWKTTSDFKYAKTPIELRETTQMVGYGVWATRHFDVPVARLSHVYYRTKGAAIADKRTTTATRMELEDRWGRVDQIAARMAEVAKATDPRDVRGNEEACYAFGHQGCDFLQQCPRGQDRILKDLFNKYTDGQPRKEEEMSLMDILNKSIENGKNGKPTEGFPTAEIASIAAEVAPELMACVKCEAPVNFAGNMGGAQRWWHNPGTCAKADNTIQRADVYPAVAQTIQASTTPVLIPTAPAVPILIPTSAIPHEAIKAALARTPDIVEVEKKKRGRPKKEPSSLSEAMANLPAVEAPTEDGIHLLVDVVYERGQWEAASLDNYIEECCTKLADAYKVDDIRFAHGDNALSFGKWKGALAVVVRNSPPPAGTYLVNNVNESEIHQVVIQTLKPLCVTYLRGVR